MAEDRLSWTFNGVPGEASPASTIRSLTTSDIEMVFQPIVELATGTLFAHEALVRCKLPQFAYPPLLFAAAEAEHACGYLGSVIRQQTFQRCPDAALFVPVNDEVAFAKAIIELMDDPLRCKKMGEAGRKRVEEKLQWAIVGQNLVDAYRTLLRA